MVVERNVHESRIEQIRLRNGAPRHESGLFVVLDRRTIGQARDD
jgi:hypothetical protein